MPLHHRGNHYLCGKNYITVKTQEQSGQPQNTLEEVLEIASEAGHILLENGAEIARIEETMERISRYYGVTSTNFFVLSNGIFVTGHEAADPNTTATDTAAPSPTSAASPSNPAASPSSPATAPTITHAPARQYANVEFIPIKGTQMDKIVEVNRLSRDIEAGKYTIAQARARLAEIRQLKPKRDWVQALGSAFGSWGFCAIFGGSIMDCCASFVVGLLLWIFVLRVTSRIFTKLLGNIINGGFVALLCFISWRLGFGDNFGNMIVGSLIPLIPGVAFTNGIRDIANEDYLAGVTRLLDAMLVFAAIAIGACLFFVVSGHINGGYILLNGALSDPFTAAMLFQCVAAFVGTIGFAVLFGSPSGEYLWCGIAGTFAWGVYLALNRYAGFSVFESTMLSSFCTAILARRLAVARRCPNTVYLLTGLFPLIPGGGIFWTTYYLCTQQFHLARTSGITAITVAFAIVLGIVVVLGVHTRPRK